MLRARLLSVLAGFSILIPIAVQAGEPFRYPEARHGKGELRYINGLPVLTVEGTPEEIGEQVAVLAAKPAGRFLNYPKDILNHFKSGLTWQPFLMVGKSMLPQFPADYRREFDAMVMAGLDTDLLLAGNTMFDIKKFIACSTLIVEPARSMTNAPMFGRNLDFPTAGYLHEYSLVTIYRPQGKHAFASIGFPGLIGCLSGMNDAGLCLAVLEVHAAGDGSKKFEPAGTPYALCYRRLLEECTTVDEAYKLLSEMKRTTRTNLAICDKQGGAVFEITPKQVVIRRSAEAICPCTNHFCSKELAPVVQPNTFNTTGRYEALEAVRALPKLDLFDVEKSLHSVNFGEWTLQTMIFEPAALRLHLAIGSCPSSVLRPKVLELVPLFTRGL